MTTGAPDTWPSGLDRCRVSCARCHARRTGTVLTVRELTFQKMSTYEPPGLIGSAVNFYYQLGIRRRKRGSRWVPLVGLNMLEHLRSAA